MSAPRRCSASVLLLSALLVSCEDEVVQNQPATEAAPKAAKKKSRKRRAAEEKKETAEEGPPKVEYQEEDFVETDRSRDPFRSFADLFAQQAQSAVRTQRTVILEDYSVDELKLIGIVSRINPAKAMLTDPNGAGHVVHRGDYLGRAERVQAGTANTEYEINWRVDRIRESDVVLVREDPSNPDVPSATRVIALRSDDETSNR